MSGSFEDRVGGDRLAEERRVRVWDPFVRFFHWSVVAGFFLAYATEDDLLTVHVWAGYAVGALVVLRFAWGFVGPRTARFSDFVTGPWQAWRYAVDLLALRAERHLGHSPAGGLMVVALLAGLLAVVGSGWLALGGGGADALAGPGSGSAAAVSAWSLDAFASEDDEHERERDGDHERSGYGEAPEVWEEIHEALADALLFLVLLHVGGVLLASIAHRENLVGAMVHGWKRVR